jgi:hypothetical protein
LKPTADQAISNCRLHAVRSREQASTRSAQGVGGQRSEPPGASVAAWRPERIATRNGGRDRQYTHSGFADGRFLTSTASKEVRNAVLLLDLVALHAREISARISDPDARKAFETHILSIKHALQIVREKTFKH